MALSLNQTGVEQNSVFLPMLQNLQANILKGHGRNFAFHLFFQFDKANQKEIKNWISNFATLEITNAKDQLQKTADFNKGMIADGGSVTTLSLSSAGYVILGLGEKRPKSDSFRVGMKARAGQLGDPDHFDEPFNKPIHMMILVADDDFNIADKKAKQIIQQTSAFTTLLISQPGNALKMQDGTGIEHFGYADGISQPIYTKDDITKQPAGLIWDDATPLERVLIGDTASEEPDSFGSFLVFRKLEQNVKKFKDEEGDNPGIKGKLPLIKDVNSKENKDLAGAMIVGRFENGVPVALSSTGLMPNPPVLTNNFDYGDDLKASKCPFHSHTRLMNPRNGDQIAGDVSKQRITRRGIPYDDIQRIPKDKILKITDEMLEKNQPSKGVGLLFMCYQSSIELQFEILQEHWANQGQIASHLVDGQDSLIGQGTNPPKTLPVQWGEDQQTFKFSFNGFVSMKGGEYFFTPSIPFLKSIK